MFLKILPYILGTLIGVYLNYNPIIPDAPTLFGVMAGLIISPIIGIPLLATIGIIRVIVAAKKTDSRARSGKRLKGISRFTLSLMGGSFFSCSFFTLLQGFPLYLTSLFKKYNPLETPVEDWNSFHYYNLSVMGSVTWLIVATVWPIFSWVISKCIISISEKIKFSDKEEKTLEILRAVLSKARKILWLIYGLSLAASIPILLYFNAWKGANSFILDAFPWLIWILAPVMVVMILFISLISLAKAFDWDKNIPESSIELLPEEVRNSSE
jgi:hypothetical protein